MFNVYRIYDASGSLLYVGSSPNVRDRIYEHSTKAWWHEASRLETQEYSTEDEARAAEKAQIEADGPKYNLPLSGHPGLDTPSNRSRSPHWYSNVRHLATEKLDAGLLMQAVDQKRGDVPLAEVARLCATDPATFSRLRNGKTPSPAAQLRILSWLDAEAEEFTECSQCPAEHAGADHPDDAEAFAEGDDPTDSGSSEHGERTATIFGSGALSNSKDPETKAAVTRVRELLAEGAVGVSIMHDMDPATMPSEDALKAAQRKAWEDDDWSELEALEAQIKSRPRHVAIVDTPAFSDAKLKLEKDGTVSGPIAFEGAWTGDSRRLPYGSLQWDEDLLPIPIIWDRQDGDHTGMTVGLIDTVWREDGGESAVRDEGVAEQDVEAVTASAGLSTLPAAYFQRFAVSGAEPLHVDAPDANGLRRVWGHAAPKGTCHRSGNGGCFQYPGDVDPQHRGFHTGAAVTLDNGETIRVGALTMGGAHIDPTLAKQGVGVYDAGTHRDNANRTIAMVRAWEDNYGLAISGVLMPSATDDDLLRMMSSAPSVELWPSGSGRTLIGIHLVPTPAWPVTASVGSAEIQAGITTPVSVELEAEPSNAGDGGDSGEQSATSEALATLAKAVETLTASSARIEKALAMVLSALDDTPAPAQPSDGAEGDDSATAD